MERSIHLKHGEMEHIPEDKNQEVKKKLMASLSFEEIKKIPKYRNYNREQYLELIDRLMVMGNLLLESYIFEQNKES